jgi:hypothetical protein
MSRNFGLIERKPVQHVTEAKRCEDQHRDGNAGVDPAPQRDSVADGAGRSEMDTAAHNCRYGA